MIALQVSINGRVIYTAGVEDWESINAFLMLHKGVRGQASSFDLNVAGTCTGEEKCSGDSVRWKAHFLDTGDEVSIKIVETDAVDPPVRRLKRKDLESKYDPEYTEEELEEQDRELYRKLKHKFEKIS